MAKINTRFQSQYVVTNNVVTMHFHAHKNQACWLRQRNIILFRMHISLSFCPIEHCIFFIVYSTGLQTTRHLLHLVRIQLIYIFIAVSEVIFIYRFC